MTRPKFTRNDLRIVKESKFSRAENPIDYGYELLALEVIYLAFRDARRGDPEAAAWLVGEDARVYFDGLGLDICQDNLKKAFGGKTMETERLKKLVKDHLGNQYQAAVNQKRVELKAGFEEEIREIRRTGRDSMGNLEAARRKYYAALETLEKEGVPGFDFESAGETAVSEIFTQQMAGEYRKEVFSLKPGDREGLQAIKNKYQSQGLDVDRVGLYSEVIR